MRADHIDTYPNFMDMFKIYILRKTKTTNIDNEYIPLSTNLSIILIISILFFKLIDIIITVKMTPIIFYIPTINQYIEAIKTTKTF